MPAYVKRRKEDIQFIKMFLLFSTHNDTNSKCNRVSW
jgi:hypothetical protein